jgi:hypothetical protein
VEAYPYELTNKNYPAVFAFTGVASAFLKAGLGKWPAIGCPAIMRYEI